MRRILMALVLVFFKDHKIFQVASLMLVSLAYLTYQIIFQPFEDRFLNKIEIFNEIIILTCYYHLLAFSTDNEDMIGIYNVGWSMDIILVFHFSVNLLYLIHGLYFSSKNLFIYLLRPFMTQKTA